MGVWERILGWADRARKRQLIELAAGDTVHVVGESHYQQALSKIVGGKTTDGADFPCRAELVPDPYNEFDKNAVEVRIIDLQVGHLSREDAREWSPVLQELEGAGQRACCHAAIRGGWDRGDDDVGHFGVVLALAPLAEQPALQ